MCFTKCCQKQTLNNIKKRGFQFGKHHHYPALSSSVLDFVAVRTSQIFMLDWSSAQYMSSRCSMSSQTVENVFSRGYTAVQKKKEKALVWKQNMRGRGLITSFVMRAAANWNSITAKTITSVCWKVGDNLSPVFIVFLTYFGFCILFEGQNNRFCHVLLNCFLSVESAHTFFDVSTAVPFVSFGPLINDLPNTHHKCFCV